MIPQTETERAISEELLALHVERFERWSRIAESHLVDHFVLVVFNDLTLVPSEIELVRRGETAWLELMRDELEQILAPECVRVIERRTGRRVVAFASALHLEEPSFATEIFRLDAT